MPARMIRNPLRMITSGRGDHALGAFFGGERQQLVQRAPLFESSGSLLIVEFEEDLVPSQDRKRF
jgi:hypothetical protein